MLRPIQRASTDVAVVGTRQDVLDGRVPLRAWYPVEVLTFPLRSREHAERRVRGRSGSTVPRSVVEQRMFEADRLGRLPDSWSEVVVDDEAMQQGIEAGSYVLDTRLRDALRGIAPEGGSYSLASKEAGLMDLRVPTVTEDLEYAEECIALREVDVESVLHRVQALEDRIIALEGSLLRRAGRRMSRILRR
jgi:hypothetical protein